MRISDWSADVCSSDLPGEGPAFRGNLAHPHPNPSPASQERGFDSTTRIIRILPASPSRQLALSPCLTLPPKPPAAAPSRSFRTRTRSEVHKSEIQSLMRNAYAVFCLHKKHTHHKT